MEHYKIGKLHPSEMELLKENLSKLEDLTLYELPSGPILILEKETKKLTGYVENGILVGLTPLEETNTPSLISLKKAYQKTIDWSFVRNVYA